jgi:hypothetical protein
MERILTAGVLGALVTSFGDARRVARAHVDLPRFIGTDALVGLVLLDDDQREQPVVRGQVIRLNVDSMVLRHEGLDEEIPLATISKRVDGDDVLTY